MAFNCFFGAELTPEAPYVTAMPPQSNVVLSQVCVAAKATFRGRMSVCVEGPKKERVCLATLHPAAGIYHSGAQLVFSSSPKFFLEVDRTAVADKKNHQAAVATSGTSSATIGEVPVSSSELVKGAVVHVTGYYERRDDVLEGQDPSNFMAGPDSSDEDEDEAPTKSGKKGAAAKKSTGDSKGAQKKGGKKGGTK